MPIFKKLYHPSITILSAESLCTTFDIQPLCINFDTHLIEYVNYLLPVISVRYQEERRLHNKLRL